MKYLQLLKAIDSTNRHLQGHAATAVNQSLVLRNCLIGAYIVEFEQHGEDRARYGDRLYPRLAADLRRKEVKGCGERLLQQMAGLYRIYPQIGRYIPPSRFRPAFSRRGWRNQRSVRSRHFHPSRYFNSPGRISSS